MTRPSKREVEHALDRAEEELDAEPAETAEEWVHNYIARAASAGDVDHTRTIRNEDGEVVEEPDHTGMLAIYQGNRKTGAEIWAPAEVVPDEFKAELPL